MKIISRKDAQAQGLKWYYTNETCKNGHTTDRLVSNNGCRECCRIRCDQKYQKEKNIKLASIADALPTEQRIRIISRKRARELGLPHYFTGKLCDRGHLAERLISNRCCVECKRINEYEWDKNNIEHDRVKRSEAYFRNHAHNLQLSKRKRERNLESCRARCRLYLKVHPEIRNAHRAKHQAAKHSATPVWLSKEHSLQFIKLYKEAAELKRVTGYKHHVDHIHPLTSPYICGLHVPWNLQILTAEDNIRKNNRFEPYFLSIEQLNEVQQHFLLLIVNINHETNPD